jgi:hypothetical protein
MTRLEAFKAAALLDGESPAEVERKAALFLRLPHGVTEMFEVIPAGEEEAAIQQSLKIKRAIKALGAVSPVLVDVVKQRCLARIDAMRKNN